MGHRVQLPPEVKFVGFRWSTLNILLLYNRAQGSAPSRGEVCWLSMANFEYLTVVPWGTGFNSLQKLKFVGFRWSTLNILLLYNRAQGSTPSRGEVCWLTMANFEYLTVVPWGTGFNSLQK